MEWSIRHEQYLHHVGHVNVESTPSRMNPRLLRMLKAIYYLVGFCSYAVRLSVGVRDVLLCAARNDV